MSKRINIYATVAKVQTDAKRHLLTLDIDPDYWDKTAELVELTGRDVSVDVWADSGMVEDEQ